MSNPSTAQPPPQAPSAQDVAEGPLLPRWFTTLFYATFIPFCLYSVFHVTRSLKVQGELGRAIAAFTGSVASASVRPDSPEGQQALAVLKRHPVEAFMYSNQELMENEESDGRMARALALRKAVQWGVTSERRGLVRKIVEAMKDDGELPDDFSLAADEQVALDAMVAERRADAGMAYLENRMTDVLEWVARGRPTAPKGPERRRLVSLLQGLDKARFLGTEAAALRALQQEWSAGGDALRRQAAQAFARMLQDQRAGLPPEAAALCTAEADRWEGLYRDGVLHTAQVGTLVAEEAVRLRKRIDHPHIYQCLGLLSSRFPEVRAQIGATAWALRHNMFAVRFLAEFANMTTINTFMAVETVRLTPEERERELRRANHLRMAEAVKLLCRVSLDYLQHRAEYSFEGVADPDEFMRRFVVSTFIELGDEEAVAPLAREALEALRKADAARPEGPVLFKEG